MYTNKISQILQNSIDVKSQILQDKQLLIRIEETVKLIVTAFQNGNKVYFCGNGGSASDAQHLAAEFSGRFYLDRAPLPSEALHCNSSFITAVSNDYGYEFVYSRMITGIGNKGDILIGLSTSGNSKNIIHAFDACKSKDILTIGMTGATGGEMKSKSDILINVPSNDTPRIQESHITIGHIICELVEDIIFNK